MEANTDKKGLTCDSKVKYCMFILNFVKAGWVESFGAKADSMVSHKTVYFLQGKK